MKKIIHPILIALLGSLCFASNCKKPAKEQKYLGTYPLGDIFDYTYFKPGSMWVYECDSTGELDTQFMVSIDTPWIKKSYIQLQQIYFTIQSINEGSKYVCGQASNTIFYNENYKYFLQIERNRSNPKNSGGGNDAVFYKPYDSTIYGFVSSETRYKGILTNYIVLGKTYDTVRVFQVQFSSGWPKISSWRLPNLDHTAGMIYYWAKGVGLVQLKVLAWDYINKQKFTHNWNLKEYKLLP